MPKLVAQVTSPGSWSSSPKATSVGPIAVPTMITQKNATDRKLAIIWLNAAMIPNGPPRIRLINV